MHSSATIRLFGVHVEITKPPSGGNVSEGGLTSVISGGLSIVVAVVGGLSAFFLDSLGFLGASFIGG